jgi:crotonobetainyl-CoA:carnitine CoA-transferase CaiB-like acyl-CoA transferase
MSPQTTSQQSNGPLKGLKIVEIAGLGPAPMTAMMLADMGATVIRIDRKVAVDLGVKRPRKYDLLLRNRDVIGVDLKDPHAIELVLELIDNADGLIEGFRPGVMERLGLGPDLCLQRNPKLVYGRVTGWGQDGPLAHSAGHDLNYVAMTGAIHALGRKNEPPVVPLSLIGDFGGGGMYLAFGMLAAIIHARANGIGQVVDAAMVDGVISLQTIFLGMHAAGLWNQERGTNPIDSGSHFYNVYECSDGKWISVAALEKRFYDELLTLLEIDHDDIGDHLAPANWELGKRIFTQKFSQHPQQYWSEKLEGRDACYAPILSWNEAMEHPHIKARKSFCTIDGVTQPAPAPRFSHSTPGRPSLPKEINAENNTLALSSWLSTDRIATLRNKGIIA